MNADRRQDLVDDAALARYLVALRDSGSALTPELAAAFDELTPRQLDVLVGLLVDEAPQPEAPATGVRTTRAERRMDAAPPADRAPWSVRAWAALPPVPSPFGARLVRWGAECAPQRTACAPNPGLVGRLGRRPGRRHPEPPQLRAETGDSR